MCLVEYAGGEVEMDAARPCSLFLEGVMTVVFQSLCCYRTCMSSKLHGLSRNEVYESTAEIPIGSEIVLSGSFSRK
jgi:hypothetical protein